MAQSFGSTVDVSDLKQLADAFKAASSTLGRHLSLRMRSVGKIVAEQAAANASWSADIPSEISVRASGLNVNVDAHGGEAAAFEHKGQPGPFHHPVFGNRRVWVAQESRPFLAPALDERQAEVVQAIGLAVDETLTESGL